MGELNSLLENIKLTQYIEIQEEARCGKHALIHALDIVNHPNKITDSELYQVDVEIANKFNDIMLSDLVSENGNGD